MKKIWEVQRLFRQRELNDKVNKWIGSQKEYPENNMSLNFAITLIVAIITVLYHSFNYFKSHAIDPPIFILFCNLFSTGIVTLLLVIIFIYLRGISFEIESTKFKKNIVLLSPICYKLSFMLFPIFLINLLFMYVGFSLGKYHFFIGLIAGAFIYIPLLIMVKLGYNPTFKFHCNFKTKYLIVAAFLICFVLYLIDNSFVNYLPRMSLVLTVFFFITHLKIKEKTKFDNIHFYIVAFSILIIANIVPFASMALIAQSHIEMQIADTSVENKSMISGSLNVLGLNENVSLSLEKIDSNEGMIEVEAITLEPVNNSISSGTIILSNYLNDGEYFISLNMSNQSSGYYKLSTDTGDSRKQVSKVFFLE